MGGPGIIDGKTHPETDNFGKCFFKLNEIEYYSGENYFQCAKCVTKEDHEKVRNSGSGLSCWVAGGQVKLRSDWESVKVREMYIGNKAKIEQNPDFTKALCDSIGKVFFGFSGSTDFWNYWNGLIIERIRAEIRNNGDEDVKRSLEIKELMDNYENDQKLKVKGFDILLSK